MAFQTSSELISQLLRGDHELVREDTLVYLRDFRFRDVLAWLISVDTMIVTKSSALASFARFTWQANCSMRLILEKIDSENYASAR